MRIIVGLGNPGPDYAETRHNAGWMAVDKVAGHLGRVREDFRGDGMLGRAKEALLFKPVLYMNRSGPPVARLLRETGATLDELLVLVDDMNLRLGAVRAAARRLQPAGTTASPPWSRRWAPTSSPACAWASARDRAGWRRGTSC